jgi:glutamate synthase domain-containing protein 3
VGDHGCEYMTGGVVAVIGSVGRNFAAGMSGGIAFVHDPEGDFHIRFNDGMADLENLVEPEDIDLLRGLLVEHLERTGSGPAWRILDDWQASIGEFRKVMPRDYRRVLQERARRAETELVAVPNG